MARRRSARRSEPDVDDDAGDDEFAWQPKKKKKKSKTGKKKRISSTGESARSTGRRSSSGESDRSGKRKRTGSVKTSKTSGSAKLGGSSRRKKSRRSESEDDSSSSTRRRRSGRTPLRKKKGINPVLPISIVTGTILLCLIIVIWSNTRPEKIVDDHPARLQEADAVTKEGMLAYRAWNKARASGNAKVELSKNREAHDKLVQAMEMYNAVLDPYRGGDDMLPPEYEGYERPLQEIAKHLVDLEKGSRLR